MESRTPKSANATPGRRRGASVSSVAQSVVSATERVLDTRIPTSFLAATAEATSKAPTVGEIRSGVLSQSKTVPRSRSHSNIQRAGRSSRGSRELAGPVQEHEHQQAHAGLELFPPLIEEPTRTSAQEKYGWRERDEKAWNWMKEYIAPISHADRARSSGYIPPPKLPWKTSTENALHGFWIWFFTPFGFLVTLYGLNVVAWGGMLFLQLCNASPAMCWSPDPERPGQRYFNCNDIDSPRRKWIEWDSQIVNALFCVTGLGLAPWRFRDLWFLMRFRLTNGRKHGLENKMYGLRKLGAYYNTWFRLPGQTTLDQMTSEEYLQSVTEQRSPRRAEAVTAMTADFDPRIPVPATKAPRPPLTGVRAPDTKLWKVDLFIWMQVWNTLFQICLCAFMWGMNRHDRPSWSTGLFVALACGVSGLGGLVSFLEGKAVKRVEGHLPNPVDENDADMEMQRSPIGCELVEAKRDT